MRHIISINEIVTDSQMESAPCELSATANAYYDEESSTLAVELNATLRPKNSRVMLFETLYPQPTRKEVINQSVPQAAVAPAVRDIFNRWAVRLRQKPLQPATH